MKNKKIKCPRRCYGNGKIGCCNPAESWREICNLCNGERYISKKDSLMKNISMAEYEKIISL